MEKGKEKVQLYCIEITRERKVLWLETMWKCPSWSKCKTLRKMTWKRIAIIERITWTTTLVERSEHIRLFIFYALCYATLKRSTWSEPYDIEMSFIMGPRGECQMLNGGPIGWWTYVLDTFIWKRRVPEPHTSTQAAHQKGFTKGSECVWKCETFMCENWSKKKKKKLKLSERWLSLQTWSRSRSGAPNPEDHAPCSCRPAICTCTPSLSSTSIDSSALSEACVTASSL